MNSGDIMLSDHPIQNVLNNTLAQIENKPNSIRVSWGIICNEIINLKTYTPKLLRATNTNT